LRKKDPFTFVDFAPEDDMTRPYSLAFKQKMVERLTGKNASNQSQLARETGVRQQNLCRWLDEARSLPLVASDKRTVHRWSVEQKARVLAEGSGLMGDQLAAFLESAGVGLAKFERWRIEMEEDAQGSRARANRIRKLERRVTPRVAHRASQPYSVWLLRPGTRKVGRNTLILVVREGLEPSTSAL
jgi:transposase